MYSPKRKAKLWQQRQVHILKCMLNMHGFKTYQTCFVRLFFVANLMRIFRQTLENLLFWVENRRVMLKQITYFEHFDNYTRVWGAFPREIFLPNFVPAQNDPRGLRVRYIFSASTVTSISFVLLFFRRYSLISTTRPTGVEREFKRKQLFYTSS